MAGACPETNLTRRGPRKCFDGNAIDRGPPKSAHSRAPAELQHLNKYPKVQPNMQPNRQPNVEPKVQPNMEPNVQPNMQPNTQPNKQPNALPNVLPNMLPNVLPNVLPNIRATETVPLCTVMAQCP